MYDHKPWLQFLYTMQSLSTIFGLYNLVLLTKGKQSCWFWGVVSYLMLGLAAIAFGYGGTAQASIFFIVPIQIIGHVYWYKRNRNFKSENKLVISIMPIWSIVLSVFCLALLAMLFYFDIPAFTTVFSGQKYEWTNNATYNNISGLDWNFAWSIHLPRFFDAASAALSVFGYIGIVFFFRENWWLWFPVDIIETALFAGIGGNGIDPNMICLWSLYFSYCFYGTYQWYVAEKSHNLFYKF